MVDDELEDSQLFRDFELVFEHAWLGLIHEHLVVGVKIPELKLEVVAFIGNPFTSLFLFDFDLENNFIQVSVVLWIDSCPFTVNFVMLDALDVENSSLLKVPFNQVSAELEIR